MNPRSRGQVLVIFVLALVAMLVMGGLILDGGNTFAQQRIAQNGADGTANAGAVVIAQKLSGVTRISADVGAAVNASATANGLGDMVWNYTTDTGQALDPGVVAAAAPEIPAEARGVHVHGTREAPSTFSHLVGIDRLTAAAEATVVAGALQGTCAGVDGCTVLPVTFPISVSICDGLGRLINIGDPSDIWPLVSVEGRTAANEAIVPLCVTSSGSFHWLDIGDGNLQQQLSTPSNQAFDIPTWLQTQTGDTNAVQNELDIWIDKPVLVPIFDDVCLTDPTPDPCTGRDPSGNNNWYHIPYFTTFWVDHAYVQGSNVASCANDPGQPHVDPSSPGFLGCIKGWFVKYIYTGPIVPGRPITDSTSIGIQLIK